MVVAAWVRQVPAIRRVLVTAIGGVMGLAIWQAVPLASTLVRNWVPFTYVLVGYYVSGLLFTTPSEPVEQWLLAWDERLFGDPTTRFQTWPRVLLAYLEIVYLGTFLLVPAGFAILQFTGHAQMADRYWSMVVGAELSAFGGLAIVQTRPPWDIGQKAVLADRVVHRTGDWFARELTIRANTFPSGHAAGSLAIALAVFPAVPLAGIILLVLSLSISVASVVGRYHYAVDVVAGIALALAICGSLFALMP
jgi:membrane-associated phospholipid phosphatase